MAAARPLVTVYNAEGKSTPEQIKTPSVMLAPIRTDIVQFVHTSMAKNHRQAYAVKEGAGMGHSAESWGTGRAVARIPRVSGGGTSRSGQGAFGNMCRKGRMFAPTRVWRKWHRKINQNQRRYAVASALAASAIPALVMARGHKIENLPEVPLVVDGAEAVTKTKQAVKILTGLGAYADVEKAKESRKIRAGVGKMRNRRHVQRRGPLVVYAEDNGITKAFRNLPGVELCSVEHLNLLQLAPGGHLGRLVVWTKGAFKQLDAIWGSQTRESVQKKGYTLPHPMMIQSDLNRLINSDEVQSKVNPAKKKCSKHAVMKKNPLKNIGAMLKLNPYALSLRRAELLTQERQKKAKAALLEAKRKGLKVKPTPEEKAEIAADKKHKKANQTHNYQALAKDAVDKTAEKKVFRTELPRDPNAKQGRVKVARVKKAPKAAAGEKKKEEEKKDEKAPAGDKKEEKKDAKKK